MKLFWHVAMMNHWQDVVLEQVKCLRGFPGEIPYVIAGDISGKDFMDEVVATSGLRLQLLTVAPVSEFEFSTLSHLEAYCRRRSTPDTEPIGYFHTKGVSRPGCWKSLLWRKLMNRGTLTNWNEATDRLRIQGVAATGLVWSDWDGRPHYSGNFWWANAAKIKSLSALERFRAMWDTNFTPWERSERFAAEMWIGSNTNGMHYSEHPHARPSDWGWWQSVPCLRNELIAD